MGHSLIEHKLKNVEKLIRMAIDVYNDNFHLTPTAFLRPETCLGNLHRNKLISFSEKMDLTSSFKSLPSQAPSYIPETTQFSKILQIIGECRTKSHHVNYTQQSFKPFK